MRLARLVTAFILARLCVVAQPCEPSPETKSAIQAIQSSHGSRETRLADAEKLRQGSPLDYFAHRYYQDLSLNQSLFSKEVQQEYRALKDEHPGDILYTLLYARTLKGTNTPELIKLLDGVLGQDPDNAQAHLKLVEVYSAPAFRDDAKLQAHAQAYWKACPASLEGYTYVRQVEGRQFAADAAARLRPLLASRSDDQALGLYGLLWTLEFKSVPLSGQDPVRDRIRRDANRLRALDSKKPWLLSELRQAYESLGDQNGLKWVTEQTPKTGGAAGSAVQSAINDWMRSNSPRPPSDRDSYNEKLVKQTEEWVRQWPDEPQARYQRFQALQMWELAPLDDMIAAADNWLRVYEQHPSFIAPYQQVASFYQRFHIRFDQLPSLLEKALKQVSDPAASAAPASDLYPAVQSPSRLLSAVSTWNYVAGMYLTLKKYDRARELLDRINASNFLTSKPAESDARNIQSLQYSTWNSMARLARADGRKMDAITYERNSMFSNPSSNPEMTRYQTNALRDQWKELKGSEEGFEAFMTKPGAPGAAPAAARSAVAPVQTGWAKLDKTLPEFEMEDAVGKTWRLADLKGKVTLVNLWATWCGPCKEELPHLQKLYDKVRERTDLAVLTLNTDDNLGLIQPFLKEHHYTFPVLAAGDYVHKLVPELSIPRNWIVTGNGVLRLEKIGFGGGGVERWVEDMIADMEKAAAPAPVAAQAEHQHHPPADAAEYARVLEDPARDAWQKPHEVITALSIQPGEVIADLGAGSGYFTRRLAMHASKVYAVDIDPKLLEMVKKNAPANVETVLATPDDPKLAPASVDTVFICEVLHHIANREAYLPKLAKALKPGGRIVVVDFIKGVQTHGPSEEMKISEDEVRREFTSGGFRQTQKLDFLPEQYFLVFQR